MAIFRRSEKRSISHEEQDILMSVMPGFTGFSGANTTFTSAKAIENGDVWSAVHLIASDIASLHIEKHFMGAHDPSDKLSKLLNIRPNKFYSGYQLKFIMVANALINGESFVEVVKDRSGEITELYHVKNSDVKYEQKGSAITYEIRLAGNKVKHVKSSDMIHLKFFSLDGIKGYSPLTALKDDMNTQRDSKKFLSNFFKNGTQNGGVLTLKGGTVGKEAREKIREEWQSANSGAEQAHKVLILDETMEYEPIQIDTEVLKLINTSNHSTVQVAKVFGIPRHKFGLETSNMSLEQMNLDYLTNTLTSYLQSIIGEISFKLIDDEHLESTTYEFDTDTYSKVDSETKVKNVKTKLEMGIISLDEARKEFGKEALEDGMGDKHLISLNYTTLDNLEAYQMAKATKGGEL